MVNIFINEGYQMLFVNSLIDKSKNIETHNKQALYKTSFFWNYDDIWYKNSTQEIGTNLKISIQALLLFFSIHFHSKHDLKF